MNSAIVYKYTTHYHVPATTTITELFEPLGFLGKPIKASVSVCELFGERNFAFKFQDVAETVSLGVIRHTEDEYLVSLTDLASARKECEEREKRS